MLRRRRLRNILAGAEQGRRHDGRRLAALAAALTARARRQRPARRRPLAAANCPALRPAGRRRRFDRAAAAGGSGKTSPCGSTRPLAGGSTRFGGGAASMASSKAEEFDRGALVRRQAGDRRLPLEGIEPAGDRRHRTPAIADIAVGGPDRIVQRAHRAQGPGPGAAGIAMLGALDLGHQQRNALRRPVDERRQRFAGAREFRRIDRGARDRQRAFDTGRASSPPASPSAPAAAARSCRALHAHRHPQDRDAAAPAMPSRPAASSGAPDAPRSRTCWRAPRPAPASAPA